MHGFTAREMVIHAAGMAGISLADIPRLLVSPEMQRERATALDQAFCEAQLERALERWRNALEQR